MEMKTINSDDLCYCKHLKLEHVYQKLYSNFSQSYFESNACCASKCKCTHFEKNTFEPSSRKFLEKVNLAKKTNSNQMEIDFKYE